MPVALRSIVAFAALLSPALAAPPRLLRSEPADGAAGVAVTVGVVRLTFDQDMKTDQWSFCVSERGTFPPLEGAHDQIWRDPRTCELQLKRLKPGATYAVGLNSQAKQGFRSRLGEPLPPTVVAFTTARDDTVPPPRSPSKRPAAAQQGGAAAQAAGTRPARPQGWAEFANPFLGFEAYVPPGCTVRLRESSLLTVEREDGQPVAAFMVPFRARTAMTATQLGEQFIRFRKELDKNLTTRPLPGADAGRAGFAFTSMLGDQAIEGRLCAVVTANGSMGFVAGVMAPQGRLAAELPVLSRIASGFRFTYPRGAWTDYRSPSNGFTLALPRGWQVETTEGKIAKNEVDWVAYDPQKPLARAFSITPKFCTQDLYAQPLYPMRGYRVASFQSPEQCLQASIGQLVPNARVTSVHPNHVLTGLMRQINAVAIQSIASLGAGSLDVAVFDCFAEADYQGTRVRIGFAASINQLVMTKAVTGGASIQTEVWCRGWVAPTKDFLNAGPVLDRVQGSMAYTPEYLQMVYKAEAERAKIVQDTWRRVNEIQKEMWQKHFDTQDAIAEMWYDHWRDRGGYVNEETGRIEQIDNDHTVKNSHGDVVSREQVQSGTPVDQATVLRSAGADDYMRGAYGRIEFMDY